MKDIRTTPAALHAIMQGDLENAIIASTSGGIERQEAEGQKGFVASESLPKECLYCTREQLEAIGIQFGDSIDDLFVSAQLPVGWSKQATDQAMWSDLRDAKGRTRASIFYKAAFYDKKAHISLQPRFYYTSSVCNGQGEGVERSEATHKRVTINDANQVIRIVGICGRDDWKAEESLWHTAKAWLEENYPSWRDATAYWD